MPVLLVDRDLAKIKKEIEYITNRPNHGFQLLILEKQNDYCYKPHEKVETVEGDVYHGVLLRPQLLPQDKAFVFWIPGQGKYFKGIGNVIELQGIYTQLSIPGSGFINYDVSNGVIFDSYKVHFIYSI